MKYITELNNQTYFEPFEGLRGKLIHTDAQTIVFWEIKKEIDLPVHQHLHEQISFVTKGQLELTIENNTQVMTKGMVAIIPSNTKHSARALTDVELTDLFTPIREDFPER